MVGGCADICNVLAEKTGSKVAGEVCMILCAVVGVKEFIAIVEKYGNTSPITAYVLLLLDACVCMFLTELIWTPSTIVSC